MNARIVPYLIGSSMTGMGLGAAHAAMSSTSFSTATYRIPQEALVGLVLGPYLPVVLPVYIYRNRERLNCWYLNRHLAKN